MVLKIYAGNLSFNTTEDTLRQAFAAFGEVTSANVIMDRATGQSKGFGFVEMPSATEAQAAINGLNGRDLGGRTLSVNEARPKTEGTGGGSRGGYGGGGGGGRRGF
ncbi:MAG: RNA-binding protein [Planctomycetes bacterium]|nr:RNA-binding protein [Planctomycetota bacterium]MBI3845186.1 RNA-binding protein [Planctomycetota bacterium]